MRRCKACGESLEGRRPQARFCDSACRTKFARGSRAPSVAELAVVAALPEHDEDVDEHEVDGAELGTLEEIAAELRRTLRSRATPPSAKANLARELRATLEAIASSKPPERDGITALFEDRRRAGS